MRRAWLAIVALLASAAAAEAPDWLKEARARESELGRSRKLKAPDGAWTARAPAKLIGKVTKDEDGDYPLNFEIGADSPIECLVFHESDDPPAFLRTGSDVTLEFLARHHGEIQAKAIERVDAGAIGGAIYMSVDWLYAAKGATGNAAGEMHLAYAVKQDRGIYCLRTELGYRRTFEALFRALVESFSLKDPPAPPAFTEIVVASIRGQRVGVGIGTVHVDAEGDKRHEETLHMLLPTTLSSLEANSSVDLEWSRGDDRSMINAAALESENGEITTQLTLQWSSEKERWTVDGTLEGKSFRAELPESSEPSTMLGSLAVLREKLAAEKPEGSIAIRSWNELDPAKLTESITTIGAALSGGRYRVRQSLGPAHMNAVVDRATGQMLSGEMTTGPATISFERVYVDGAP